MLYIVEAVVALRDLKNILLDFGLRKHSRFSVKLPFILLLSARSLLDARWLSKYSF